MLQAGVFGEHRFTRIAYQQRRQVTTEETGRGQTTELNTGRLYKDS